MSIKKYNFLIYIFGFLSCIGFVIYSFILTHPARYSTYKMNMSEFSSHGEADRLRLINIKEVDSKNLDDSDSVEIFADITLPFDDQNPFDFKWTLGENVQLVEGQIAGQIKNLKKDRAQTIHIKVRGYNSSANRHIALEVSGQKNNRRIYSDALISSQKELSFEHTVQQVERLKFQKFGIKK